MSDHQPTEAELEEARAKKDLHDAEADAEETLERAEELAEHAPDLPEAPE